MDSMVLGSLSTRSWPAWSRVGVGVIGIALATVSLATGVGSASANQTDSSSAAMVGRYYVGPAPRVDGDGHIWMPDSQLSPGGAVYRIRTRRAPFGSPLMRRYRQGVET